MFDMKGLNIAASGAIQGHRGSLVALLLTPYVLTDKYRIINKKQVD